VVLCQDSIVGAADAKGGIILPVTCQPNHVNTCLTHDRHEASRWLSDDARDTGEPGTASIPKRHVDRAVSVDGEYIAGRNHDASARLDRHVRRWRADERSNPGYSKRRVDRSVRQQARDEAIGHSPEERSTDNHATLRVNRCAVRNRGGRQMQSHEAPGAERKVEGSVRQEAGNESRRRRRTVRVAGRADGKERSVAGDHRILDEDRTVHERFADAEHRSASRRERDCRVAHTGGNARRHQSNRSQPPSDRITSAYSSRR